VKRQKRTNGLTDEHEGKPKDEKKKKRGRGNKKMKKKPTRRSLKQTARLEEAQLGGREG